MPTSRNQYIVIINYYHENSYNDGFVINIPKVVITDSSSSTIIITHIILVTITTIC